MNIQNVIRDSHKECKLHEGWIVILEMRIEECKIKGYDDVNSKMEKISGR